MQDKIIKTDIDGIEKLLEELLAKVEIPLSEFADMDENLCALLGALHRNQIIKLTHFNDKCCEKFRMNSFVQKACCSGTLELQFPEDSIPYIEIERTDYNKQNKNVLDYIQHYILLAKHVPKISEQVKNLLQDAILEFFSNAFGHTGCEQVFACGRWDKENRVFHFTIVNIGETIQDKVSDFTKNECLTSSQAIEWAMVKGHSTKKRETGGLGLSIITDFVEMNNGDFYLISGDGALHLKGNTPSYYKISKYFPGTFVDLVFNLSDPKWYIKVDEKQETVNFKW